MFPILTDGNLRKKEGGLIRQVCIDSHREKALQTTSDNSKHVEDPQNSAQKLNHWQNNLFGLDRYGCNFENK